MKLFVVAAGFIGKGILAMTPEFRKQSWCNKLERRLALSWGAWV